MKRTAIGIVSGALGLLLALELLCRLLPVSSATRADYHIDPAILTYAPHHSWRYATGWDLRNPQSLRTNGHGFVSDHEFVPNPRAVAFIGDSYVESASLAAADRPAAQLERALGGQRPVYALGAAGTSLLDYAERIRFAHQQFNVHDFVLLLERGDLAQALCGSGNVASQCLDAQTLQPQTQTRAPTSWVRQVLRESMLAEYLASQLRVEPTRLLAQVFNRAVPAEGGPQSPAAAPTKSRQPGPEVDAVAAAFFERAKPHVQGRLVLVLDADRQAISQGRHTEDPARIRFMALARAAGAMVVDLEPVFKAHYATSPLSLDLSPQDGHFNPVGVRLLTGAAAAALAAHALTTKAAP